MARKIFLGFSNQSIQIPPLIAQLCADWSNQDCVYIFSQSGNERIKIKWTLPVPIIQLAIPEGNNGTELWEIYHTIYDVFQDNDEVMIDIYSCPQEVEMLLAFVVPYARFLKNIQLRSIYCSRKDQAPLNLTAFSEVKNWSEAASDFICFGNIERLNQMTEKHFTSVLNGSYNLNEITEKIRELNVCIENLRLNIATNRAKLLIEGRDYNRILELITSLQQRLAPPLDLVWVKLKEAIQEKQGKNEEENMLTAVQWCIKKSLIQEGFNLLQEGIISYFLKNYDDKNQRNYVEMYLNHRFDRSSFNERFQKGRSEVEQKLIDYLESFYNIEEWSSLFAQISEIRDDLYHGGMNESPLPARYFETKLKELFEKIRELLNAKKKNSSFSCYFYKESYY
ncbi:MAG: TM1812 family CRISPR-associated protein [Candidatus Azobacteroides sp.]|nr:TM1812 family CRISPR-associated protein [Candidatus Azobacteroides sp.]